MKEIIPPATDPSFNESLNYKEPIDKTKIIYLITIIIMSLILIGYGYYTYQGFKKIKQEMVFEYQYPLIKDNQIIWNTATTNAHDFIAESIRGIVIRQEAILKEELRNK